MNWLFLLGCIPARLFLVLFAAMTSSPRLFSILLFSIATGFLYLYFTNGRLDAAEAGGKTWWHHLRIIHGVLYLTAAILALAGSKYIWIPLLIDVVFGLVVHVLHEIR
jgi:hypothetical protein